MFEEQAAAMPVWRRMIWPVFYFVTIVTVNWSFSVVGFEMRFSDQTITPLLYELPGGGSWTPMTIVTGLVLVFRDFAQRAIGHWVLAVLAAGLVATTLLAGPELALASGAAFAISELADWAIYTWTKRPLHERIVLSSLVGAPLDSFVFFFGASFVLDGVLNVWSIASSVAGKLAAAIFVAEIVRRSLKRQGRL